MAAYLDKKLHLNERLLRRKGDGIANVRVRIGTPAVGKLLPIGERVPFVPHCVIGKLGCSARRVERLAQAARRHCVGTVSG